ncbi:hypothetical protein FM076_07405 [Streptomyces albus subsp. chlorinus]|uniref:SWIM zinc finger family protein n=1 Tax=Streptomyces albus TaxID=1888 RepID=UPI0015701995|nr:SWIM zinc finger family protein [Streptomyces albus]NSC21046.1 hypothetical protein [Streptomyces albus subsp. chlorinus]
MGAASAPGAGAGATGGAASARDAGRGGAWLRAMKVAAGDGAGAVARLERGRAYAAASEVFTVRAGPGRITAYVRGSRPRPYRARWRLPVLTDAQWDLFVETAAARPAHVAALLDGAVPDQALDEAEAAGVRLLPAPGELLPSCSCPDQGSPCKHAAALGYETARLLDADPGLLFLLRGRDADRVREDVLRHNARLEAGAGVDADAVPGSHQAAGPVPARTPELAPEPPGGRAPREASGNKTPGKAPGRISRQEPAPETSGTEPASWSGIPAHEVFATSARPPLPDPLPVPEAAGGPPAFPELPGAPSADALAFLAEDAATRARLTLAETEERRHGDGGLPMEQAELSLWHDTARLAATHPRLTGRRTLSPLFAGLARAAGRDALELARAAAAWRQGGPAGLAVLDTAWDPPAGDFDRGRSALAALGITMTIQRNRLTHATRPVQLRYGRDGRWYPYRAETAAPKPAGLAQPPPSPDSSDPLEPSGLPWWPEGPAASDPVRALTGLRERG